MLRHMDHNLRQRGGRPRAALSLLATLAGCTPIYYVVRSTPVREVAAAPAAPATSPVVTIPGMERIALLPWEVCTSSAAEADACAAGLAALEQALLARGLVIVPWQTLRETALRHDKTALEAAQLLSVTHLVRIGAPETRNTVQHVRFQRSYHDGDENGGVGAALELSARDADRLDVLAGKAEQESVRAVSAGAVRVTLEGANGALLWSHRESLAEPASPQRPVTLVVRCHERTCSVLPQADAGTQRPARQRSERVVVSRAQSPQLLERVAEPLAARIAALAGRAEPPSDASSPHDVVREQP
jgi:hypothetical protein